MGRRHTPFGYRIKNGCALICEEEAQQLQQIYDEYLAGKGYSDAAKAAGLTMTHSSVKRLLQNEHYLGDEYYPAIIDQETFDAAEEERLKRIDLMGRNYERKQKTCFLPVQTHFSMGVMTKQLKNPYEQAAYIYSLIESEG